MARSLIIAGGGIGGLAAGLALHQAGLEFRIFERAAAFAEAGAGMSLWPNATRILDSWGVLPTVLAQGEPVTQFNLLRPNGRLISAISMRGFSTPALCIHRADLHRALLSRLPVGCLEANQKFRAFHDGPQGVEAHFASGRAAYAGGLIGADGISSAIRNQLHGARPPTYRGYCIWRGLAPQLPGLECGHISESWGAGCRFGVMPIGQGRICWYATRNGPPSQPDGWAGRKAEVLALFHDWHDPIPALIRATPPGDILKSDARDRSPLRRWGAGRVTLLGDAAHPLTPNVGQGACMAIEDAACLAKALANGTDVAGAFRAYERARRGRTAHVARQARRIGAIGQWENALLVGARNLVTRFVLASSASMQMNAIYAYKV